MVSLQAFLLLLAFAEQRKTSNRNFILAAEEPELHLHPSLHQRLVHRIRSASVQSIITTQSPHVAGGYQPHEVVFIRNVDGHLQTSRLRNEPIKSIAKNSVRKLYLIHRDIYYKALMGGIVLIPEGISDYEWLTLWQKVAESSPDGTAGFDLRPITFVPTSDAAIVESFEEVVKFRPDAIPIIDGDAEGDNYLSRLCASAATPAKVIRYGENAAVEYLAAWILEPALSKPGDTLASLLVDPGSRKIKNLQNALIGKKDDRELRESLAWEALDSVECCQRACEFFHDLAAIAVGGKSRNANWQEEKGNNGVFVFIASYIKKA